MRLRVQRLDPDAVLPSYATAGSCAADLTATSIRTLEHTTEYGTGLAFEIPDGYVGLLCARSSVSKTAAYPASGIGVIDSDYRGEVTFRFKGSPSYQVGDRIGQLLIVPCEQVSFTETPELTTTERGERGYGSTGQ